MSRLHDTTGRQPVCVCFLFLLKSSGTFPGSTSGKKKTLSAANWKQKLMRKTKTKVQQHKRRLTETLFPFIIFPWVDFCRVRVPKKRVFCGFKCGRNEDETARWRLEEKSQFVAKSPTSWILETFWFPEESRNEKESRPWIFLINFFYYRQFSLC